MTCVLRCSGIASECPCDYVARLAMTGLVTGVQTNQKPITIYEMTVLIKPIIFFCVLTLFLSKEAPAQSRGKDKGKERKWLAGDHHIHSHFSAGYDESTNPPTPSFDKEPYAIPVNAKKAREHGLSWMVSTDHGGPNHSKINLEHAYPELSAVAEGGAGPHPISRDGIRCARGGAHEPHHSAFGP
jgi:hypothetical protein